MKVHNIQKITIFFCALFISTFGHEYLKAHHDSRAHLQHSNRNHHQTLLSHFKYRAGNDSQQQQCDWECIPESDDKEFNLSVLVQGLKVALYNTKEHVAIVVDVKAQISAVFNGTSGGAVLINLQTNKGYDVTSGVWLVSNESFEQFFFKITSLETIWTQVAKNGTAFEVNKIPDAVLQHIAQVFQFLGVQIAVTIRASLKATITLFLKYAKALEYAFKILSYEGHKQVVIKLRGDLEQFVKTVSGIAELVAKLPGGLRYLADQGIEIPYKVIYRAKSGIEAFVNLLEKIGAQVNLAQLFKDLLKNPVDILKFIVSLGGDITVGINGFFKVLYKIAAVHNNDDSLSNLIEVLIHYSVSKSFDFNAIRVHIQKLLQLIDEQIKKYNTDDEWTLVQNFLQKLLSPKSVAIGGISISELLNALTNVGKGSPVKTLVSILWAIRVSIKIQETIPQLILTVLRNLNSQVALRILIKLVPDLQLKYSETGEIDVIATVKNLLKPQNLVPVLSDLPKLLRRLPIIGTIIKHVSDELQKISHNEYNFDDLVKCNGARKIAEAIQKWLKQSLNLDVNIGDSNSDNHGGIGGIIHGIVGGHGKPDGDNNGEGGKGDGNGKGEANNGQAGGSDGDGNGKGEANGQAGGSDGDGKGEGHGKGDANGQVVSGGGGSGHVDGKGEGHGKVESHSSFSIHGHGGHLLPHHHHHGSHGSEKAESKRQQRKH